MQRLSVDWKVPLVTLIILVGTFFVCYYRIGAVECNVKDLGSRVYSLESECNINKIEQAKVSTKLSNIESLLLELRIDIKKHLIEERAHQ